MTKQQNSEDNTFSTTLLAASNRNSKKNQGKDNPSPSQSDYRIDATNKDTGNTCQNIINDIEALLKGGNRKIQDPKYYIKDPGKAPVEIAEKTISQRISELKTDVHDLFKYNREINNPKEGIGSYTGHQRFVNAQKAALRKAITDIDAKCKNLTPEQLAIVAKAKKAVAEQTPEKPDPKPSTNASQSQQLKGVIDGIPGLNQEQKTAIGQNLNRIQKVGAKGQDYWEKHGKQQVLDILTTAVKLPLAIALAIAAAIANMFGFDLQRVQSGSNDNTASVPENSPTPESADNNQITSNTAANPNPPTFTRLIATNPSNPNTDKPATFTRSAYPSNPNTDKPATFTRAAYPSNSNTDKPATFTRAAYPSDATTKPEPTFTRAAYPNDATAKPEPTFTRSANPKKVDPSTFVATGLLENYTVSGTLDNQQPQQQQQGPALGG